MDKISAQHEWERAETRKAFEGMSVDWTLLFWSAGRVTGLHGEEMKVTFVSKDEGNPHGEGYGLVYVPAPIAGNEHLPVTDRSQEFKVRGIIESVTPFGIRLRLGATFEMLPEKKPTPTPKVRPR